MRIRSTKPEFWKSRRIASVSWEDRLLLKGLESYVDDNGVGVDDVELIVTDVFPRDMFANPRETVARVSEGLCRLHHAGLLHRYTSETDNLLYISWWEEIQRIDRPGKGRNPRPDGTYDYKDSVIRESVASPREGVATGTGEQGNRGTEEQGHIDLAQADDGDAAQTPRASTDAHNTDDAFATFWNTYPIKRDKKRAHKAFAKALTRANLETILAGAERYRDDPNREDAFTKYAEGWLNGDGWDDDPLPPRRMTNSERRLQQAANLAQQARHYPQHQQDPFMVEAERRKEIQA